MQTAPIKIHLDLYANELKPRPRDWHKGLSGHVLLVGGDLGYSGALRLAAKAALRVGAGRVTLLTRVEHMSIMNVGCPEIMSQGITSVEMLAPFFAKANTIVLGPGLGQSDWSKMIWENVINQDLPMIVDADGLNLLANHKKTKKNWILTPHPLEAARLLNQTISQIQGDRLSAAKLIHETYGGICVLKGAGTLIVGENTLPALCDKGNPGMATAGMGDVLSGVLGGLLAQGISLEETAKIGVCLHALAGDLAAKKGERGMIASDLMPYLRKLSNSVNWSG